MKTKTFEVAFKIEVEESDVDILKALENKDTEEFVPFSPLKNGARLSDFSIKSLNDVTRKYLVTMDGYKKYYGSYVDFVGLFNTRDEAERAIDECLKYAESLEINIQKEDYEIFEVDEGWWHYPHQDDIHNRYETIHTDMPLGGYEE